MASPRVRLFIAVSPPPEVRQRIADYVSRLKAIRELNNARWLPAEQYHITLRFLGESPVAWVPELLHTARELNRTIHPGTDDLRFSSLVAFPQRSPRVLALSCDERSSERLGNLRERLHARLAERLPDVPPPGRRPFRPHLTLARFRRGVGSLDVRKLPAPPEVAIPVRMELVRSELTPSGAIHTRVEA